MVQLTEINNERAILINSANIADDMDYAIKNNIKKIVISSRIGNYKLDNVNFLEAYPEIQDLAISTYLKIDYSTIHSLKALKKLSIDVLAADNQKIDFSCFPSIEEISFDWRKQIKNIESASQLKYINISKLKTKNLEVFSNLKNIVNFSVFESSIENLSGIENFSKLERLTIVRCPNLTSIESIAKLVDLEHIRISNCKNLTSIKVLENLNNIKFLELHNCGEIESIAPIKNLKNLKEFNYTGDTKFLDNHK